MADLSYQEIRKAVDEVIQDIIKDFKDEPDTDRETVIERLDEECDSLFGNLVAHGRIDQWDVDDLCDNAQACSAIIKAADRDAWIEDDHGLWDGLTYGVLGSIAYFSLRNLLYKSLELEGHDTNDDYPFERDEEDELEEEEEDEESDDDEPAA